MKWLTAVNKRLSSWAPYFAMVAAILALGSGILASHWAKDAKAAKDLATGIVADDRLETHFAQLLALVNEEAQAFDTIRSMQADLSELVAAHRGSDRTEAGAKHLIEGRRTEDIRHFEHERHLTRFVIAGAENARRVQRYAQRLGDKALEKRANDSVAVFERLIADRLAARRKRDEAIAALGDLLKADTESYMKAIGHFQGFRAYMDETIAPAFIAASKEAQSVSLDLQRTAEAKATNSAREVEKLDRFTLWLYIIGSFVAIYGKWLELHYPKKVEEPALLPAKSKSAVVEADGP